MDFEVVSSGANGNGVALAIVKTLQEPNSSTLSKFIVCLINCGDSFIRCSMNYHLKLSKLSCILITSLAPHNISGVPGLLLSLSSIGKDKIRVIGPPGLASYFSCLDKLVKKSFPIVEITEVWDQECGIPINIFSNFDVHCNIDCLAVFDEKSCTSKDRTSVGTVFRIESKSSRGDRALLSVVPVSISFAIVPSKVDILQWCLGMSDCETVFSTVLSSCSSLDRVFSTRRVHDRASRIIVALPLDCFCSNNPFQNSRIWQEFSCNLLTVGNILLEKVKRLESSDLNASKSACININGVILDGCLSSTVCELRSSQRNSALFRHLSNNSLFAKPILGYSEMNEANSLLDKNEIDIDSAVVEPQIQIVSGYPTLKIPLLVLQNFNSIVESVLTSLHGNEIKNKPPVDIFEAVSSCAYDEFLPPPSPSDATVTFLGTGSAAPSKYRNGSCIVLKLPSPLGVRVSIILDAGEGVCLQLFYHCSGDINRYFEELLSIRMIWISHSHLDHMGGIPMLMEQIRRARICNNRYNDAPVMIIGSNYVFEFINSDRSGLLETNFFELFPISMTVKNFANPGIAQKIYDVTGGVVVRILSVPVVHCAFAFAVVLNLANGKKIVYSGDCRPAVRIQSVSDQENPYGRLFAQEAYGCDLLIHEATFEDNLAEDAIAKKHSTTSEALFVGQQVQAKNVVLTHFSQRYPRLLKVEQLGSSQLNYIVTSDLLSFSFPSQFLFACKAMHHAINVLAEIENQSNLENVTGMDNL